MGEANFYYFTCLKKKSFFEEKRILFFVQNFRGVSTEENLHFGDSVQQNSFPAP